LLRFWYCADGSTPLPLLFFAQSLITIRLKGGLRAGRRPFNGLIYCVSWERLAMDACSEALVCQVSRFLF
jgi:hypothetical protein